jgi:hypothetical protein
VRLPALLPFGVIIEEVKWQDLPRCGKPMFADLLDFSHDVPTTARDTTNVYKIGHRIVVGLL